MRESGSGAAPSPPLRPAASAGMPPMRSVAPHPPAACLSVTLSPQEVAETVGGVGSFGEAPQLPLLLPLGRVRVRVRVSG